MAKQELEQAIADLGLVVKAEFVPFSQSRHAKKDAKINERSLNWRISLCRMAVIDGSYKPGSDRILLTTDYSAGIGHTPMYQKHKPGTLRYSLHNESGYIHETEKGTEYRESITSKGKPIQPDTLDVIHSLLLDSDVLNYPSFEQWADDSGYDTDSRKAENTYKQCLAIALALRNGVGDEGLRKLQEAAQDY